MNKFIQCFLLCCALALGAGARAEELGPDALVTTVTNDVLDIVKKDKDIQAGNTKKATQLIDAKVLPHFNFTRMTQLAVGRDWRQATPAQQKSLTEEFRELLVRTYTNAFTSYKNQSVTVKPTRVAPTDTDVTVRTQVVQPGGQPLSIDYALMKMPEGWKVYDVTVEASSLVTVYRGQFSEQIKAGGVDGLVAFLHSKNQAGDNKSAKK